VGVGWLSACAAYLARRRAESDTGPVALAWLGATVSVAIILMKAVPGVPGSFTRAEWIAFGSWSAAGLAFWILRQPARVERTSRTSRHSRGLISRTWSFRVDYGGNRRERLLNECVLRQRAENLNLLALNRFRNAGDLVAARQVWKLRRLDRNRGDVGAGERHLVCEADRPRAVRSRRRRKHLHRHRL